MSSRWSRRKLIGLCTCLPLAFLALTVLPGCSEPQGYPDDLEYPQRADAIVVEVPTDNPTLLDAPGDWDRLLVLLKEKGGKAVSPADLNADSLKKRDQLNELLKKNFGSPLHPLATGLPEDASVLKLDKEELKEGSRLYRRHCVHCHGLSGDGRGPTGAWVNPHPRDYRKGIFKFTSTIGGNRRKPSLDDLVRTLREGIDGTSMPSFGQLPAEELVKMSKYVIHLSLRGQMEEDVLKAILTEQAEGKKSETLDVKTAYGEFMEAYAADWVQGQTKPIAPSPNPYQTPEQRAESIKRGYDIFRVSSPGETTGLCNGCHQDYGRRFRYDWDQWGNLVRPNDLTSGIYRGGRRPVDIYYRLHGGINGSKMAAVTKPENERWDLINFVLALPYPDMLPLEIRKQVYPDR